MAFSKIINNERREWDLNSRFHQNDKLHPYRLWFWQKVLSSFEIETTGKSILEVGCGAGLFTSLLKNKKNQVYGVDFSKGMIKVARKNNPSVKYKIASADKLPFADNSFDIVVAAMLFHHLEVQNVLTPSLGEMKRVLKKGGYLCVLDHSGNFFSKSTLAIFNQAKRIFVLLKGKFPSSGVSAEIPFQSERLVITLKNDFELSKKRPISTVFFQILSAYSHGIEYLLGEKPAIIFEKITLPFLAFWENHLSPSWFCTELCLKFLKPK